MATLVLSAAGAALGGPIGAAVGRFAGRQIDRSFGASATRRLSDVRLPSAQYGDSIPAVRGRMRVAGMILWSSPPVATAVVSKNGSSQSQSISFALAVSSSRVDEIGRIWADGRLIRDRDGQQNVFFTLRLHHGDEDQPSDELVAAVEGVAVTPAYRGIAYLVFEDFDLSSFGNRLPLITAELTSSAEALSAEALLRESFELADSDKGAAEHPLEGAAVVGDNAAEALAPFVEAFAPSFGFGENGWSLHPASRHHLIDADLWAPQKHVEGSVRRSAGSNPEEPTRVSLRYFDPALDFAAGEKSARLPGAEKIRRIELPGAMDGAIAKSVAFEQLARRQIEGKKLWLRLPLSFARIAVGDEVSSAAIPDTRFVVGEKRLSTAGVTLLLRSRMQPVAQQPAEAGGVQMLQRLTIRPLSVAIVELPGALLDAGPSAAVVVSGGNRPYEPVPVNLTINGVSRTIPSSPAEGISGTLVEELRPAPSELIDKTSCMRVRFDEDPVLTNCDNAALLAGANLIWVGGEFVQFGTARWEGEGVYLLSDLLRGRSGSENDTSHEAGTPVIVLDPLRFSAVAFDAASIGADVVVEVRGYNNAPVIARLSMRGLAAMPWSPAHLKIDKTEQGLDVSWIRRNKAGGPWLDHVDSPLGSPREEYVFTLQDAGGGRIERTTSQVLLNLDRQALDQLGPRPWRVEVRQLGDFVAGRPARIQI